MGERSGAADEVVDASAQPRVRTLLAGDLFVRNDLLRAALVENLGDQLEFSEISFEWPSDPFGPVAEVKEAAGTEEQLIAALAGQEIIVTEMAALTRHVIKSSPDLRLIVVCRGGPVNVNLEAATEQGIPVCYSPARNAAATAEYTIGLLLSAMRHISEGHHDLLNGTWRGDLYAYDVAGIEIEGKTAGLIGFGAVGSRVAKVLRAFGAEVLVADPYVSPEAVEAVGATLLPMDEVLPRADILSLHARLTPETHHLIDADAIAALPDGAVLINAARGGLLDTEALCAALRSGKLRAAALDVYDPEPPAPDSCIFSAPNLVLSPHLAGASRETAERACRIAADEVARYVRGERLAHVANPAAIAGE
jgi:D-3-phosphoglycerate dehydrogenase